jgi:hypothetical protein
MRNQTDALITNQAFLTSPGMVPQFFLRPEASLLRVYLVESQRTCVALPILTTHFSIFAVFTCLLDVVPKGRFKTQDVVDMVHFSWRKSKNCKDRVMLVSGAGTLKIVPIDREIGSVWKDI